VQLDSVNTRRQPTVGYQPTKKPPRPRQSAKLLPCLANLHRWDLANSAVCECCRQQIMHHVVNMRPSITFDGALQLPRQQARNVILTYSTDEIKLTNLGISCSN